VTRDTAVDPESGARGIAFDRRSNDSVIKNRTAHNGPAIFGRIWPSPLPAVDSPIHGRMFFCYSFRKEN
jgi:hypothetical protein